ncbi:MAG: histone deacetylase family protein [Rhodospirillaceae bacterium]|jgi:acetoin utilization deacetylase AcuC-like enzyme|nr:histone deacetylase family protein [Rhodospirillaceae bacterium]MBT5666801.1 histone deacetylase family protein [Rhodospirillaceae bacterium]MBT5811175.1 histone deacetylase family protein [Rhodospirillaceae bacterium]
MSTILFTHESCLDHEPGPGHPESPDRLNSVLSALKSNTFNALIRREAPMGSVEQIARIHPRDHVEAILAAIPAEGRRALDPDTIASPGSGDAALRAAGAACAAVDAVLSGDADNGFCAVRPPGHHAEQTKPMGFCLFNSIAVGAEHARAEHGLARVAVVDFDVHHGNGTQAIFWNDADLFYASTHQFPFYPGTGDASERGATDNIVNAPLSNLSGSREFQQAFDAIILPELRKFQPELIMISAGFDAHAADPLASLMLTDADYRWVTTALMDIANDVCDGRIVSMLEGGYDLAALDRCAGIHVETLMTN